jgi:hypothetical protein
MNNYCSMLITLSPQAIEALEQIAVRGIYGKDANEVAARLVDRALQEIVYFPRITCLIET